MRPVLWRHRLTGAALFGIAVLATLTPTTAILASSYAGPPGVELPQEEIRDDGYGVQLAWDPIAEPEPEPEPEPQPEPDGEAPAARRAVAEPVAVAPIATPTARSAAREARVKGSPASAPTRSAKAAKCLDPDPRIRDLGGDRYEVDRALAESYADLERLRTLGFVVQHEDASGRPDGYRIGGIRCGNALHQSGLRRGDVVRSVNGRPTRNAVQIMTAWMAERDAEVLRIEVVRQGERRTLVYRLT